MGFIPEGMKEIQDADGYWTLVPDADHEDGDDDEDERWDSDIDGGDEEFDDDDDEDEFDDDEEFEEEEEEGLFMPELEGLGLEGLGDPMDPNGGTPPCIPSCTLVTPPCTPLCINPSMPPPCTLLYPPPCAFLSLRTLSSSLFRSLSSPISLFFYRSLLLSRSLYA